MDYEVVIGLECHAQLLTSTKIFCGCSTAFGAPPNSHTCPVCLGLPGALPVLNRQVVEYALRAAHAFHCQVRPTSRWARKNYFYPDLPKGYQITQYVLPVAEDGLMEVEVEGSRRHFSITRIHMEEDAGKNIHVEGTDYSLVDYNRAGIPLVEIVGGPDLRSPVEAVAYLKSLRNNLMYLGICDGNMEEGSLRCDANISLRPHGRALLGARVEIKNLNSFRFLQRALEYEVERQAALLDQGQTVLQETRLFDSQQGVTRSMRTKEEAQDYRYFPDPDLPLLTVDQSWSERVKAELPELPLARADRFIGEFGLPAYDAQVLVADRAIADYFEVAVAHYPRNPKQTSNWIMTEVLRAAKERPQGLAGYPVTPERLAELIQLIDDKTISGTMAKEVFAEVARSGEPPAAAVKRRGGGQVSDPAAIEAVARQVVESHPDQVAAYRGGKSSLFGFFVGQVMRQMRGKANPQVVNSVLKKLLG